MRKKTGCIDVHGATYAYTTYGRGEALVCLHGFTGSRKTWEPFLSIFGKSFQVITIDLPGHSETKGANERTMETFCRDLAQLLTKLEVKKAHVLGYSFGGRVALSFANIAPERVQTLVLESASPGLQTEKERTERRQHDEQLARKLETNGVEKFVDFWENIALFESQKSLAKNVRDVIRRERLSQTEKGLAASLRHMGTGVQPSWWDTLEQIDVPVALITGELDPKFVNINDAMKKRLPYATHFVVKNAGHAVHVEQVKKFAKIVMTFVKQNRKEGAINDSSMGKS